METLKDIFVSYETATKLKEIGFDEPCIAGYCLCQGVHPMLDQMILNVGGNNGNYDISAPTYEQVFKWFREKEFDFFITPAYPQISFYKFKISDYEEMDEYVSEKFKTYEQAREQLIYKLIEIYKNGCKK